MYDLKSAYHHISIFPEHKTYLGFSWVIDGKVGYFVYNVLPFGLSTSGFIFSKVTRHFVKHVRAKGHKVVMYLDDRLAGASDHQEAAYLSSFIKQELDSYGFILAHEKCDWDPKQVTCWLGFEWDFSHGRLKMSADRMNRITTVLHDILIRADKGKDLFSARLIASFVGQLISCKSVLGNFVKFDSKGS